MLLLLTTTGLKKTKKQKQIYDVTFFTNWGEKGNCNLEETNSHI